MHTELWESTGRVRNGKIVEDFIDKNNMVVLNDGRPTWFKTRRQFHPPQILQFHQQNSHQSVGGRQWTITQWDVIICQ